MWITLVMVQLSTHYQARDGISAKLWQKGNHQAI